MTANPHQRIPASSEPLARGVIEFLGGPRGRFAGVRRTQWWTPLRAIIAVQKSRASFSAVWVTFVLSSPTTITAAWFLGSSAQAYPIQMLASTTPG